jgi:beta-ribofuranosylaminobenzene 5'-phosphate synthase
MSEVIVQTPSRLAFTLIDLNGSLGRIDGSVGVALENPGFRIRLRKGSCDLRIEGDNTRSFADRIADIINRMRVRFEIGGVEVLLEETIPSHCGLGSGTQLSLAIAHGIAELYDVELSRDEAPSLVGRGGTSGIGVAAFYEGGFILDGGHRFPDQKSSYLPSSASRGTPPPPVILRRDFPQEWRFLIVIPPGKRVSGDEEVRLFTTLCPVPLCEVERVSHIILMEMFPALAEMDLERFGDSIDRIQKAGWKRIEVERQDEVVRETMRFLKKEGALGVGLSSWGPALYAVSYDPETLLEKTERFLRTLPGEGICFLAGPNNRGAFISK